MADRRFGDVDIRGPARLPGLGWRGNVLRFFADPFAGLTALARRPERLVALADRHPAFLCAFGPEHNHRLLTDRTAFDPFITPLRAPPGSAFEVLVDNPFTTTGERWRCHRRAMVPPFHKKRVARYRDVIVDLIDAMLAEWRIGDVIDLPHALQGLTLSAMMSVVFGLDVRHSRQETEAFRALLTELLDAIGHLGAMFFPVDLPATPYRRMRRLAERFVAEVGALAERRRGAAGEDVLSDLVEAHHAAGTDDPRALVGEMFSLLTAGHETTYAALSWALLLLAAHPAVLGDLHDELCGALRGAAPTVEQLGALPLLDRVVREALRLLPTAPYGARITREETTLGGHSLPRGAVVIYSAHVTHHLPEVFERPRVFDPERWHRAEPSPYAYLPFGAGPRTCLGAEFALMEMKLTLACLLQRFWPALVPGRRVDCRLRITLRPHPGLWVTLCQPGSRLPAPRLRGTIHDAVALGG